MKKFCSHLAALFIVLTVASSAAAQTITGTVKDGDKPINEIIIRIPDANRGAMTDSLGRYKISHVPKGKFAVKALSLGNRSISKEVEITSDSQTVNLDFQWPDKTLNCDSIATDYHERLRQVLAKDKREIELKVKDGWLKDETLIVQLEITNHSDVDIYLPKGNGQPLPYSVELLGEDGCRFEMNYILLHCGMEFQNRRGLYEEISVVKIAPHESVLVEPISVEGHRFGRARFERGQLVARYRYSPELEWEWTTDYTRSESDMFLEHKDSLRKTACKIFRLPLTSEPEPLIVKRYGSY
ncbi:MAG: carboxypeptidase-like regulatory domain-containing protein [Rhizobacter sp.]|nr:carboxypeptidase-like regulatory domain-containing protein [Chlorobiales bacterium]